MENVERLLARLAAVSARHAAEGLSPGVVCAFRRLVHEYYRACGRDLPWRQTCDPYAILVSEVMLQQTQVERVVPKYLAFLAAFPTPAALAAASVPELLAAWQGLGYNRRALALQATARRIDGDFAGHLPTDMDLLRTLPGIGPYTAAAVLAFACDQPTLVLETNIRAVYLHTFFPGEERVSDRQLLPLVEATLDRRRPRDWYNGLMDLGGELKRRHGNPARRSAHHARQGRFAGSDREIRGAVLRLLLGQEALPLAELERLLPREAGRVARLVDCLVAEGFLEYRAGGVALSG